MTYKKLSAILSAMTLCTIAFAGVTVRSGELTQGPVKIMNAVNNGPIVSDKGGQDRDNFEAYRDARIPFARTHDAALCVPYGAEHTVDITAIFPDFSKDVNDPASYDFVMTDYYLDVMRKAGTEPFFRLGQKIENNKKKYGIFPPADYQKWAEICEHIIRHYNEGWANGFKWNIQYWEIWNEADNNDNNIVASEYISVDFGEKGCSKATAHLTDHAHKYTEIPLYVENGVAKIKLEPNSFIMIEY